MGSVWIFVWNFVVSVLGLIIRFVFRNQANDSKNANGGCGIHSRQDDQTGSSDSHTDGFGEEEAAFREPDSKPGNKSNAERESSEYDTAAGASRYVFLSRGGVRGFLEGPETTSFSVRELYAPSDDYTVCNDQSLGPRIFADEDFRELKFEEEAIDQKKAEDSVENFGFGEVLEKAEQVTTNEKLISGEEYQIDGTERYVLCNVDVVDEVESVSEDCSLRFESETESNSSNGELSMSNHMIDSITYEVLASKNVGEGWECEALLANDEVKVKDNTQEVSSFETSLWGPQEIVTVEQSHDSDEEYIELEPHLQNLSRLEDTALFAGESGKFENKHEEEDLGQEESQPKYNLEETKGTEPSESKSDYQTDLEFLWEHGDVLELLKMELKNLRSGGLPTILEEEEEDEEEEPESPAMVEDLKPLKIEEKFEFKDRMEEIQKVYKCYSEKMRKLDILNSQTMHAIGFLQLKEPAKSISMQKSSASAAKSLPHNMIWPRKARRVTANSTHKLHEELQCNLELVYVGQVCLSWEILHWLYVKAQELQEYDSQGFHSYNQVADEFQLFQVLLQRFIENEPYQGPRLRNYVNNRCVLRNLLQVPPIRDDCMKDKRAVRTVQAEEDAISSGMIAKIIEESMRVFWEFLRADHKVEGKTIRNVPQKNHVNLQNGADLTLLMDIRADLQKKEKRLKDILRSGNCIVKKFQKHHNDDLGHSIFFARVELKLVSRVLNMSRLTRDQLVWCQENLDQINIVSRKIQVEPSFFLFPC